MSEGGREGGREGREGEERKRGKEEGAIIFLFLFARKKQEKDEWLVSEIGE